MSRLEGLQRLSVVVALVCGVLGLATSTGCNALPAAPSNLAWTLHPILFLLGALAGVLTSLRHREVENQRQTVIQDPLATRGEQDHAHQEAERQRRFAGTAFLLGPLGCAYWMAYYFEVRGVVNAADFFLVTPVLGFLPGLLLGRRTAPPLDIDDRR